MEKAAAERGKCYSTLVDKLCISGYKTCTDLYLPSKNIFIVDRIK